jgi:Spy/CpxP family protein refolding chaperone
MMRMRTLTLVLAVLLLAPVPLLAQQRGGMGQQGPGAGLMAARAVLEQGSVEYLASRAADLQLTDEQAGALKAIGEEWARDTKPARDQVRSALPAPGQAPAGDRQAMMQQMMALMPVMQKLVEDDEKAVAEAMKALSEEQQATAKKLLEERREAMRMRRGG